MYTIESSGDPIRFRARQTFAPVGSRTRIGFRSEARVGGLLRLIGPLVVGLTRRQVAADYPRLKALMEAGAL